jgi:hypothetical protein
MTSKDPKGKNTRGGGDLGGTRSSHLMQRQIRLSARGATRLALAAEGNNFIYGRHTVVLAARC